MKLILLLIFNILMLGNCYSQTSKKHKTLPYSTKKNTYICFKGGLASSQIRYTTTSKFTIADLYGGLSFDNPISYNKSIEVDLLFSYFGSSHFVELPLLFKFFLSKKTNILTGIAPNILVDALSPNPSDVYSDLDVFGLSGLLGGQHYYTKKWYVEAYYSRGFISQFEDEEFNRRNGIRDTFRIGVGYILN